MTPAFADFHKNKQTSGSQSSREKNSHRGHVDVFIYNERGHDCTNGCRPEWLSPLIFIKCYCLGSWNASRLAAISSINCSGGRVWPSPDGAVERQESLSEICKKEESRRDMIVRISRERLKQLTSIVQA